MDFKIFEMKVIRINSKCICCEEPFFFWYGCGEQEMLFQ